LSTSFSQRERNKRARNARANVTSHSCSASEARAPHARVLAFFSLRARFSRAKGDVVVKGKRGLDGFPGTDLESTLVKKKIETVVLSGFLTHCCVESTMRTAYEKGFNTITLTDCCATTSAEGHKSATEGTFGMFSSPMTGEEFLKKINA